MADGDDSLVYWVQCDSTWRDSATSWNGKGYVQGLSAGDSFFLKAVLVNGKIDASRCAHGMTWADARGLVTFVTQSNRRHVTIG